RLHPHTELELRHLTDQLVKVFWKEQSVVPKDTTRLCQLVKPVVLGKAPTLIVLLQVQKVRVTDHVTTLTVWTFLTELSVQEHPKGKGIAVTEKLALVNSDAGEVHDNSNSLCRLLGAT